MAFILFGLKLSFKPYNYIYAVELILQSCRAVVNWILIALMAHFDRLWFETEIDIGLESRPGRMLVLRGCAGTVPQTVQMCGVCLDVAL